MIIEAYGIKLQRLTEDKIELVRYWRNSDIVKNNMEYREYITPEMQQKWFQSVNNIHNNYFLIYVPSVSESDKAIGVISGAEINWEEGITYNGGIFIWDESFYETTFPAKASVLLTDISFLLGMKKTFIKVIRDNHKSINFNKLMGYVLMENQENVFNQEYVLTKQKYDECIGKVRKTIGAGGMIKLTVTDKNNSTSQLALKRLETISAENRSRFNLVIKP